MLFGDRNARPTSLVCDARPRTAGQDDTKVPIHRQRAPSICRLDRWPRRIQLSKRVVGAALGLALAIGGLAAAGSGWLTADIMTQADLERWVDAVGAAGPLLIIGLMTVAVVISPLPSAPIALASGAAFGHGWGTLYVLLGAEIGALIAFSIARVLGRELVTRWLGSRLSPLVGSQTTLMLIVFFSRLLPFVSFDLVSYAAGLTSLAWWRFALATAAGIVPASFLLAHLGGEMANAGSGWILTAVGTLGLLTVVPMLARGLLRSGARRADRCEAGTR